MDIELASSTNTLPLEQREIFTVSDLNRETRTILEECFNTIWVTGEISNLARPNSGHLYFSLKDERAQIRCAFFRNSHRSLRFNPENGQQVLIQAQVSLYEARGDFQLIISHMELAGAGSLQLAFEALKKRLNQEGLFAIEHKKAIPKLPQQIGIVTSSTGAAIRDILNVLQRRFPSIPVIIYPTLVQGDKAAQQIATALTIANQRHECDVIILARGGGSIEDLWPFNEEIVARAIFKSKIPIITGIGHEVDFTIADFVADQRAPTPSAAAEQVTPNRQDQIQALDHWEQRLVQAQNHLYRYKLAAFEQLTTKLQAKNPFLLMQTFKIKIENIKQRLVSAISHNLEQSQQKLKHITASFEAMSPLSTLSRGYAIVSHTENGKIIYKASMVKQGDSITTQLNEGFLHCRVEKIMEDTKNDKK